jgi:hypothetical protein
MSIGLCLDESQRALAGQSINRSKDQLCPNANPHIGVSRNELLFRLFHRLEGEVRKSYVCADPRRAIRCHRTLGR